MFNIILSSKDLLSEYNQEEINIMQDFLDRFNKSKKEKIKTQ